MRAPACGGAREGDALTPAVANRDKFIYAFSLPDVWKYEVKRMPEAPQAAMLTSWEMGAFAGGGFLGGLFVFLGGGRPSCSR